MEGLSDERAVTARRRRVRPCGLDARTSGRSGPFASDEGTEQLLRGAGLVDVRTTVWEQEVVFADDEQWHTWSWSHGQRVMWEAVPEQRRPEVRMQALEVLGRGRDADGRLTFRKQVRCTLGRRREQP